MEKPDIIKIVKAITLNMPCERCPYPCEKKQDSSFANCDLHWFNLLKNMDTNRTADENTN